MTGCNLRCRYCHNPDLVKGTITPVLSEKDVLDKISSLAGKNDYFCLTGGEPLAYGLDKVIQFIGEAKLVNKHLKVKLDTNGQMPISLKRLLAEKGFINYIAIDLKAWDDASYKKLCGEYARYLDVIRSIHTVKESGCPFEIRTTVIEGFHTEQRLMEMFNDLSNFIDTNTPVYLQKYRPFVTIDADKKWKTPSDEFMKAISIKANEVGFRCEVR